jgi:hypothetical protein
MKFITYALGALALVACARAQPFPQSDGSSDGSSSPDDSSSTSTDGSTGMTKGEKVALGVVGTAAVIGTAAMIPGVRDKAGDLISKIRGKPAAAASANEAAVASENSATADLGKTADQASAKPAVAVV